MQRIKVSPRPTWQQTVEDLGFPWHTSKGGAAYWDETAYWSISLAEAEVLQNAAREGYEMILDTIEHVITTGQLALFGYDVETQKLIEQSWENSDNEPTLYGRFDIAFDGGQPKILEYNGDHPGGVFETAMVQRQWAQELFPNNQQFNVLHEQLLEAFQYVGSTDQNMATLHITGLSGDQESEGSAAYLANCAEEAGVAVCLLGLHEIGYEEIDGANGRFIDLNNETITNLLKLRPTEWMIDGGDLGGPFRKSLLNGSLKMLEPAWKMLASNKRLMVSLWERYAYHPLLLETSMTPVVCAAGQVRKPIAGYEGQNIVITDLGGSEVERTQGAFAEMQSVYQERAFLANGDGNHAVCGVWLVNGDGVALGIRESEHLITDNNARFVPHIIEG